MDKESMRLLIGALRDGEIGLNDRRQRLLKRVPEPGDWGMFRKEAEAMDLVWLAAATGDCFELYECSALYHGSIMQILRHGDNNIGGLLEYLLAEGKVYLIARCRPGEIEPEMGTENEKQY